MRKARAAPGALLVGLLTIWCGSAAVADEVAPTGPALQLRSERRLAPSYGRGVARVSDGWVVSGTDVLARLGDDLKVRAQVTPAIPPAWQAKGYERVGDIDAVGRSLYVPFEHPNDPGHQAMARFDTRTLAFMDAVEVAQHENPFIAVDPATMIAYSMDRSDGDALVRYDLRDAWAPLPALRMDTVVRQVHGGAVGNGAVWLSTDDDRHEIYRVDVRTGTVDALGSSGHLGGHSAGEGIDASPVGSTLLHVLTIDPASSPVWVDNFAVTGLADPGAANRAAAAAQHADTTWPPFLVVAALGFGAGVIFAVTVVMRRARLGLRTRR